MSYLYLQNSIIRTSEANIPAISRGAVYGDGCFETLKSYQGKYLALDKHIDRLNAGMQYLGITAPKESTEGRFAYIIQDLLERNQLLDSEARIRIQIWRTGPLGYPTPSFSDAILLVNTFSIGNILPPSSLHLVQTRRIPNACLPSHLKLSNGLNYILAQREAAEIGNGEALMCSINGHISETSMANIFWIRDGVLETPALECDVLPGITRQLIIDAAKAIIPVAEVTVTPDVLQQAECVFTSNSLRELHPITSVDDNQYDVHAPSARRLLEVWQEYRNDMLQ